MNIYERIRMRRIELGLSQEELARRLGYKGKSTISKVENGERDLRKTTILKYAEALDVNPSYLLLDESQDNKWIDNFKESLAYLLEKEHADLMASHIDTARLCDMINGDVPISFLDACSIADAAGMSLDEMVGICSSIPRALETTAAYLKGHTDDPEIPQIDTNILIRKAEQLRKEFVPKDGEKNLTKDGWKRLSYHPYDIAIEAEMAYDLIIDTIHTICNLDYDTNITMNDVKNIEIVQNFIKDNEKTLKRMMGLLDK